MSKDYIIPMKDASAYFLKFSNEPCTCSCGSYCVHFRKQIKKGNVICVAKGCHNSDAIYFRQIEFSDWTGFPYNKGIIPVCEKHCGMPEFELESDKGFCVSYEEGACKTRGNFFEVE